MSTPALELSDVGYAISGRPILNGISLTVNRGEVTAVVGPSGTGKSTLVSIALGLLRPTAGDVRIAGTSLGRLRGRALARHRSEHVGVVFQHGELLAELTPLENVALPGLWSRERQPDVWQRAEALLQELNVTSSAPDSALLSGGERIRVAVARALINDPDLIVADEPTGGLDRDNAIAVLRNLVALPRARGCAVLIVTHDQEIAELADCVVDLGGVRQPRAIAGVSQ